MNDPELQFELVHLRLKNTRLRRLLASFASTVVSNAIDTYEFYKDDAPEEVEALRKSLKELWEKLEKG